MSKTSTALAVKHALARVRHHTPKPIIIRAPAAKPAKKHHKHHGGGGGSLGGLLGKKRMGIAMGAAVLGFVQKQNITIPKLPMLGEAGTIGLVAYFLSNNGRNKLADDVCTAAFAIALYELGSTGTITGELPGGEPQNGYPDVSGYAPHVSGM